MREKSATDHLPPTHRQAPDVPLPTGASWSGEWFDDEPPHLAYRVIYGRTRSVGDTIEHRNGRRTTCVAEVETSACQLIDGTLETSEPPQIQVYIYSDDGVNPDQARQLAADLLEAAAEVDGWIKAGRR